MMKPPSGSVLLSMFSGPLIWAAHFAVIYGYAGIVCARGLQHVEWLGVGMVKWVVGGGTLLALAAILTFVLRARRDCAMHGDFMRWLTAALGILSMIAICWEAMPAFLLPACAVP